MLLKIVQVLAVGLLALAVSGARLWLLLPQIEITFFSFTRKVNVLFALV